METQPNKSKAKRGFDAVAASREWKNAVADVTANMSIAERMSWFRSQSSVPAIRDRVKTSPPKRVGARTSSP